MESTTVRATSIPLALAALVAASPFPAQSQGLTYTLVPSARWIEWDDDLGFDRGRLVGGSFGIGFGRYVGLNAFYHQDDDVPLFADPDMAGFRTDLVQTGAQVTLALGTGVFVPVITGGGSILRFDPADSDRIRKLSFDFGGGLKAVFGETVQGEVIVESTRYRLDPFTLLGEEPGGDDDLVRRNLTLRAGLGVQLGRRSLDQASELDDAFEQRYQSPFANFALAVEPLVGQLQFDDETELGDQDMFGVRAGFDFGSFFGLRGLYWWGTDEVFGSRDDFSVYGGEAQFNLAAGPGLNPFLVGGVSQLEWDESGDPGRPNPAGQTALVVGGGVDFNFGPRLRATLAARDFVLASSDLTGSLQDAAEPDDLVHNWQISGGLKFVIGGQGIRSATPRARGGPDREDARTAGAPVTDTIVPAGEAAERNIAVGPGEIVRPVVVTSDTVVRRMVTPEGDTVEVLTLEAPTGDPRAIVIPILESGEIHIRFGPPASPPILLAPSDTAGPVRAPAAISEEVLRRMIREELRSVVRDTTGTGVTVTQLRELERRLQRRLDQIEAASEAGREPTPVDVTTRGERADLSRATHELRLVSGLDLSGGAQLLLGVGTDIGPLHPGSAFNVVPQFVVGYGEGKPSYLLNLSLEYRFAEFHLGEHLALMPMISLGPSLFKQEDTDLRLSTFLGTGIRLFEATGGERVNLFAGLQGVDLFDEGRLNLGLRLLR